MVIGQFLWQTIPAGFGILDSFTAEYRQAGDPDWIDAGAISTIDSGVGGRINHFVAITGLQYDTDYEYRVTHLRSGAELTTYGDTFHTRLAAGDSTAFTFVNYGDSAGGLERQFQTRPEPDQ